MKKEPKTIDISGQFILLGTGTSVGVPTVGCWCDVCASTNPRNKRTRASAIVGLPEGNLLIDTAPDLRTQLIREGIGVVHSVVFTHEHADHIFGLDDLRIFQFYLGHAVPLYCEADVEDRLRESYSYVFADVQHTHRGAVPALQFHRIGEEPFHVLGAQVTPIRLRHGPRFDVLGFRVGDVAYCTDTNEVPPASLDLLQGLDCLIIDALRPSPHQTHFSLEEAVAVASLVNAKQTYFTHCSCELDYEKTNAKLPAGMELAYDGLKIPFTK